MRVDSVFVPQLSSKIKILIIDNKKELLNELKNLTTDVSELAYTSWVLETFVVGINQHFSKWIILTGADPNSINELKNILYKVVLKNNPLLNPKTLYIDDSSNITLDKTDAKLINCQTWKIKTDKSNLIVFNNGYEVEKIIQASLSQDHYILNDVWSFYNQLPLYIRIFNKKSFSALVGSFKPKSEEELKYFIILSCIDNFFHLYDTISQDSSINHINIALLIDSLFEIAVTHNPFLNITLKDIDKIHKEKVKKVSAVINDENTMGLGVEVKSLSEVSLETIQSLESKVQEKIFGQDLPIKEVCKTIKKAYLGIKNRKTPIGAFFFYGPTSTGKTELAKVIAKELIGTSSGLIKVSCGTMSASHSVYTLLGAPPGYIGHEEGGFLEKAFKKSDSTFKIILFDEIEKASSKIFDTILEMLEEGELMLANGTVLDVSNCLILFTSNVGQAEALKVTGNYGFSPTNETSEEVEKRITSQFEKQLKELLKPEFIARLNGSFYFRRLTDGELKKVALSTLTSHCENLKQKNINIIFDATALLNYILNKSTITYGKLLHARHVRNFVEMDILEKLGNFLISLGLDLKEKTINISIKEDNNLNFTLN